MATPTTLLYPSRVTHAAVRIAHNSHLANGSPTLTSELLDALRAALAHVTISEELHTPQALPQPQDEQERTESEHGANTAQQAAAGCDHEQEVSEGEQEASNYERVKAYLATHPYAKDRDIADALTISVSTANKWRKRVQGADVQGEQHEQHA